MRQLDRFRIQDLGFKNGILVIILTTCFLNLTSALALAHGGVDDNALIIRMTKNGFEPKELTVTEGDVVTFVNNGNEDHWPASNFHPTHTLYPEFDPLKGVKPGESWKFKFAKVGTWRMHDHLFPHLTGTIVVLPDPDQASSTTPNTQENPTHLNFWQKVKSFFAHLFKPDKQSAIDQFKVLSEREKYTWLENVAAREGPKVAWEDVLAAYKTPEGVIGNPHDMAHLVGQLLYNKDGLDGLVTCTPDFAFGCYHGLMEVAFDKDTNTEKSYQEKLLTAQKGCEKVGVETSPTYWSCIHGMGHGIATYRDHDLSPALKDCDSLTGKIQTYCHDGVFMEFSISAPTNFYKTSDPLYPCDVLGESYKIACARSQVQVMRLRFHFNTAQIADTCNKSGNENIQYHCIDALGYFVTQNANDDAQEIIAGCHEIKEEQSVAQCLAAAAGELVFQDAAGWPEKVITVCQSLVGNDRSQCKARVAQVKESYGRK